MTLIGNPNPSLAEIENTKGRRKAKQITSRVQKDGKWVNETTSEVWA